MINIIPQSLLGVRSVKPGEGSMRSSGRIGISGGFRLTVGALVFVLGTLASQAQQSIILDGSTGMMPLARSLAAAYQQQFPSPVVQTGKGLGTGARLRALGEGKIQVALASHGIDPEVVRKGNLRVIEVAKGAIVFAADAGLPVSSILIKCKCAKRIIDAVLHDLDQGGVDNYCCL